MQFLVFLLFFSFCKTRCDWNFWIQMSSSLVLLLWFFFVAPSGLSKFFPLDIFWDDTLMLCNKHSFSWALTVIVFLIFFKKEWWNTDLQQFQVLASCFVLLVLFLMTLSTRFYFFLVLVLRFIDLKRFDKNNQVVVVSMCAFLFSFVFLFCKKRCDWNFWIQMSASLVLSLWFFFFAPSGLSKVFPLDVF